MKTGRQIRTKQSEAGIALLISIFILLLISVVAIALIVSSGTESALAGNYRSSTGVYYAALAGLEEVRGRLQPKNPSYFGNTSPGFLPTPPIPLSVGFPVYVINPLSGETVAPWDSTSTYYDNQYNQEFASSSLTLPSSPPWTFSIWNTGPLNSLPFPGPLYKWVRINAVSAKSLNVPVAPSYISPPSDSTTPVYYDGTQLNISGTGAQVLELTALAVLPNGSQKLVQYLSAPIPVLLPPFPAALTLAGNVISINPTVGYSAPATNNNFWINGNDQDCNGIPTGSKVPAIGVLNSTDTPVVTSGGTVNGITFTGIPSGPIRNTNYPGLGLSPDVQTVNATFNGSFTSPSGLDSVAQTIIQNADATVPTTTPAAQTAFLTNLVTSGAMSSTSPLTVVVNGDLDLTGWHNTGYGLLLVTGNLTYDPDASWDGVVMVVGQGTVIGWRGGSGIFIGAMLVARTRDTTGVLLSGSNLGYSYVDFNHGGSMGGDGIRYSNCWIQKAQPNAGNKILSFHEISQ
jgi:hypothetical protein